MRKNQREISGDAIQTGLRDGEKLSQPSYVVSLDEKTKVVATKKGSVVSVSANKRNTDSDLLRVNANQEKCLLKTDIPAIFLQKFCIFLEKMAINTDHLSCYMPISAPVRNMIEL